MFIFEDFWLNARPSYKQVTATWHLTKFKVSIRGSNRLEVDIRKISEEQWSEGAESRVQMRLWLFRHVRWEKCQRECERWPLCSSPINDPAAPSFIFPLIKNIKKKHFLLSPIVISPRIVFMYWKKKGNRSSTFHYSLIRSLANIIRYERK